MEERPAPLRAYPTFGLAFTILAVACSSPNSANVTIISDSAGIRVVETLEPLWKDGDGWGISPQPTLEIGVSEGDEHLQFFSVSGAARLSDDRIVVLNNGTRSIRLFDSGGSFLQEFGGRGEGPGEFETLSSIDVLPGDTLFVWDRRRRTYSLFDASGAFLESRRLTWTGREQLIEVHPLPDGNLAAKTYAGPGSDGGDPGYGVYRATAPFLLFGRDGILLDTIAVLPNSESSVMDRNGTASYAVTPFNKDLHWDVGNVWIALGTTETMEISLLDPSGKTHAVFRDLSVDLTLSAEDRAWYERIWMGTADTPDGEIEARQFLDLIAFPDTKAAFSDLRYSAGGEIWLRTGRHLPYHARSREWTVISGEGVFMGTVTLPEDFSVLEVGAGDVLGVWRDEFGVEFIRVYSLLKNAQ